MSQIISILLMLDYASNFVPPIRTFHTVENDFNFVNHTCGEMASLLSNYCSFKRTPLHIECYSRMGE